MNTSQEMLVKLGRKFGLDDFVETGTGYGNTLRAVQTSFLRLFSIEIEGLNTPLLEEFKRSQEAGGGTGKLRLFVGSSAELLPGILKEHSITRALFWLDAHRNDLPDVIGQELEAIAALAPDSLVVVDDITEEPGRGLVCNIDQRLGFQGFEFGAPAGWQMVVRLDRRAAILHRGKYDNEILRTI